MKDCSQIRIGIIGAMDEEVELLRREAAAETPVRIADMDFCEGVFDGRPVVIAKCGVGKVKLPGLWIPGSGSATWSSRPMPYSTIWM